MVHQGKTAAGWDWAVLERRAQMMSRAARYLAVVALLAVTAGFATARVAPGLNVAISVLLLGGLLLVIVAVLSALSGEHVYLLDARRYWYWLRDLRPYEPANFWEQHSQVGASVIGGIGMLVLGLVLGMIVESAPNTASLISTAWSLIGWLVMAAVPLWWTIFVVRLGGMHHRAINRNELPVRPSLGPFGLLILFFIFWMTGMVAVVLAEAAFPLNAG